MSFNRPINCHYYDNKLFVLGDILRKSLFIIDDNSKCKKLIFQNSYHYIFGVKNKIYLLDLKNNNCDFIDINFSGKYFHSKIEIISNPKKKFFDNKNNFFQINFDPHLKKSIGISYDTSGNVEFFQSEKEICGMSLLDKSKSVIIEYFINENYYICEVLDNKFSNQRKFPFHRNANIGFRYPSSTCIIGDSFFVLDSSNYAFKKFNFKSLYLEWIIGKKGKELGEFDRCNSISLLHTSDICLSDMNNDRLIKFNNRNFSILYERDDSLKTLNRPFTFSKNKNINEIFVVSRDNDSLFLLKDKRWKFIFRFPKKDNLKLIGYEKIGNYQFQLFRGYESFYLYKNNKDSQKNDFQNEILMLNGDIQDYDYYERKFFFLNSTQRKIISYDIINGKKSSFDVFHKFNHHDSLSKGISYGKKGIIIVGFYTGRVNLFDMFGNLIDDFLLPKCNDIFRKVIYLTNELYLVLSRRMVRIFSKYKNCYVYEFNNFEWSSPCDAIIMDKSIFISNKELDRIEKIDDFNKFI